MMVLEQVPIHSNPHFLTMFKINFSLLLSLSCILFAAGCNVGGNDGKFEVKGTVSYDGQSVDDGMIVFMPLPGASGTSESIPINRGAFTARLPEGKRDVLIYGFRPGPAVVSLTTGVSEPTKEQYIPAAYNDRSALSVDIVTGMAPLVFDLEAAAVPRK